VHEHETVEHDVVAISSLPLVTTLDARSSRAAERIHIERDTDATAEHHHLKRLVEHGPDHGRHGTRPVDEDDEPVVLASLHGRVTTEDVVGDPVVTDTHAVEDAGGGDTNTRRRIGGLTHLKLLHHERHDGLAVRHELARHLGRHATDRGHIVGTRNLGVELHELLGDVAPTHDDLGQIRLGQSHVLVASAGLGTRRQVILHRLLRRTRNRTVVAVTTGTGLVGLLVALLLRCTIGLILTRLRIVALTGRLAAVGLSAVGLALLLLASVVAVVVHVTDVAVTSTVAGILLLARFVVRLGVPQVAHDVLDVIEGLGGIDALEVLALGVAEVDTRITDGAELVVQVDAVSETQSVQFIRGLGVDAEEVIGLHVLVGLEEVAAHTGELLLHHAFDAGVLHDVEEHLAPRSFLVDTSDLLGSGTPRARHALVCFRVRSEQGMADLVTDQHIVDLVGHVSPHGERENAIDDIHAGGLRGGIVAHGQILRGEDTRKQIL